MKLQIFLNQRGNLTTANLRCHHRDWSELSNQLKQPHAAATVIPGGTGARLLLLISVNTIPDSRSMLDQPKIRCDMSESRNSGHVIRDVNHKGGAAISTNRLGNGIGRAEVSCSIRDRQNHGRPWHSCTRLGGCGSGYQAVLVRATWVGRYPLSKIIRAILTAA